MLEGRFKASSMRTDVRRESQIQAYPEGKSMGNATGRCGTRGVFGRPDVPPRFACNHERRR